MSMNKQNKQIQMKKFQYINIHNGFVVDESKFKQSLGNTKQIVFDVHCGPTNPLLQAPTKLLSIVNIKNVSKKRMKIIIK